ncbi:MAG: hypothetical protein K9J17_16460 [Flavobacteriales bacterium]|nr:hypothetical protein [Flavobacteriales bacterium]
MPTYTFTPSETYALGTHEVIFTSSRLQVKLSSSGLVVFDKSFSGGISFRCDADDFQIGTLSASNYMTKTVNLKAANAKLWLDEKPSANKFIGSNDSTDDSIYNIFNTNQCPVTLSKSGNDAVMKCPCDGAPCTNGCYQYGV